MKTISHTINGLASSLLLNIGLTAVAQKLDPVSHGRFTKEVNALSVSMCAPCEFTVGGK